MQGLYAVVDIASLLVLNHDPFRFASELLDCRLAAIQVRAKNVGSREFLEYLRPIQAGALAAGVPLFANDRPDLAALCDCAGVHLGQDDLSMAEVRKIAPQLKIGLSTHNLEQVGEAVSLRPDYLAYGPVFPTRSKLNAEACVGLSELKQVSATCRQAGLPLVAIGGIDTSTLPLVTRHVQCVALISAFIPQPNDGTTVSGRHQKLMALQQAVVLGGPGEAGQLASPARE